VPNYIVGIFKKVEGLYPATVTLSDMMTYLANQDRKRDEVIFERNDKGKRQVVMVRDQERPKEDL
jgi:hypothetical protein